jgi:mannitol-specific phosphotransferase system IIBC component
MGVAVIVALTTLAFGVDDKKAMQDLKTTEQKSQQATKARTQEGASATARQGTDTKGTYVAPVKAGSGSNKTAAQVAREENKKEQDRERARAAEINRKNKANVPPPPK